MKQQNRAIGSMGETAAAQYLEEKGYEIVERNYRNKWGEVDIVARVGETVVLVEVKTKTEDMFGEPWEMINKHKLKQITQMGYLWCMENHYHGLLRIDVVGIWMDSTHNITRIEHWENVQL